MQTWMFQATFSVCGHAFNQCFLWSSSWHLHLHHHHIHHSLECHRASRVLLASEDCLHAAFFVAASSVDSASKHRMLSALRPQVRSWTLSFHTCTHLKGLLRLGPGRTSSRSTALLLQVSPESSEAVPSSFPVSLSTFSAGWPTLKNCPWVMDPSCLIRRGKCWGEEQLPQETWPSTSLRRQSVADSNSDVG